MFRNNSIAGPTLSPRISLIHFAHCANDRALPKTKRRPGISGWAAGTEATCPDEGQPESAKPAAARRCLRVTIMLLRHWGRGVEYIESVDTAYRYEGFPSFLLSPTGKIYPKTALLVRVQLWCRFLTCSAWRCAVYHSGFLQDPLAAQRYVIEPTLPGSIFMTPRNNYPQTDHGTLISCPRVRDL